MTPGPAVSTSRGNVLGMQIPRPYSRPTESAVWGLRPLICAFDKSAPGKSSVYQHWRTTGVVMKGMVSGARWPYYLGQFICLFVSHL